MRLDRFVLVMGGVLAGLFGLLAGGVALSSSAAAPGLPVLGQPGAEPLPSEGCPLSGQPVLLFYDDFESGAPGWISDGPGNTWALWSQRVHSGRYAYHAYAPPYITDQRLMSPPIFLPPDKTPITLSFWNYQQLERWGPGGWSFLFQCYDGALLEISTSEDASWETAGNRWSDIIAVPFGVTRGVGNPLGGEEAWCEDPQPWTRYVIDLTQWAGKTVRLRFRLGTDFSVAREGWAIDDVALEACRPLVNEVAVAVDPPSLAVSQPVGAVTQHRLQISNRGDLPVSWRLAVEPIADRSIAATGGQQAGAEGARAGAQRATTDSPATPVEITIADGGFEAGTPNPFWREASSSGSTLICSRATCSLPEGAGPRSGEWWVWFGGQPGVRETATLSQTILVRSGYTHLHYWVQIPAAQAPFTFTVSLDGRPLLKWTHKQAWAYRRYEDNSIGLGPSNYDRLRNLRFDVVIEDGPGVSSIFLDDVVVQSYGVSPCAHVQETPWLTVTPSQGTLDAIDLFNPLVTVPITVSLSASATDLGVYRANLCLTGNARSFRSTAVIPVRMEVFQHPNRISLPLLLRK